MRGVLEGSKTHIMYITAGDSRSTPTGILSKNHSPRVNRLSRDGFPKGTAFLAFGGKIPIGICVYHPLYSEYGSRATSQMHENV